MIINEHYILINEYKLLNSQQNFKTINNYFFSRICYYLELQSQKYGNQWIMTEFDAFSSDINDYVIPSKIIQRTVNNLSIKSSEGVNVENLDNGYIEFTPFNYHPGNNTYDTHDNLKIWENHGNYGCMQIHLGENVLWAFNRHNDNVHDLGIGNNTGNEHKDWTFMTNSNDYTIANLKIYAVKNEVSFDTQLHNSKIDLLGVAHGDSLIYNVNLNKLTQTRIPYISNGHISKPNFIIALTGQSNSQGCNAFYDSNNIYDQPHERIFGFNSTSQSWEIGDLNTESSGSFWHKPAGWQSLAFHFAKRLVEAYPDIRPGIINLGIGGQNISRWAKFSNNNQWYQTNIDRATFSNVQQGDIYDMHVEKISQALSQLDTHHQKLNVICWHQGESDGGNVGSNYYTDALKQVINQYRNLPYCDSKTPFIVGETTGGDIGTDQGWEARNIQLRNLNIDADPYTKCVNCADLETSNGQYNNNDEIHFSANAQRKMGTRYFRAFRSIFEE